jgi:GTP cyclohydrolase I
MFGPALQLGVAGRARRERELAEQLSELVDRDRVVARLVGVNPDCDHHFLPSAGTIRVMWRPPDRAVSSDVQASMKSRRHPWTTAGDRSLRGH